MDKIYFVIGMIIFVIGWNIMIIPYTEKTTETMLFAIAGVVIMYTGSSIQRKE